MKRQAKLTMALSAAAVLSAGMSMTSFAGSWLNENGSWSYLGDNGEKVTEEWVKSGENWFWLDSSGQMAAGQLLEIKNDYYYFQPDGAMVHDQWISLDNENAGEEDEPEKFYYYFQSDGKAHRRSDSASSGSISAKEIGGKKYTFDTEGRMLYGWVSDGERQTGEDAWMDCDYYFGPEGDGAMRFGWDKIRIIADPDDEMLPDDKIFEEEDQDRWFYFSQTGKKTKGKSDKAIQKKINGQKYGFDEYGRMISSWYADPTLIKRYNGEKPSDVTQGGTKYTQQFMYYGSPESGARFNKGWFRATPSIYLMESKHLDQETYTYYADGDGNLYANEIRTIDGERYAFDAHGRLMGGLQLLTMEDEGGSRRFTAQQGYDKKGLEFSDLNEFEDLMDNERRDTATGVLKESMADDIYNHKKRFYYFKGPNNSMLTGKQTIRLGDQNNQLHEFMFEDSGYLKGSGVNGEKDGKLWRGGWLLKPEEGQKYIIIEETQILETNEYVDPPVVFKHKKLKQIEVEDFIESVCNSGIYNEKKDETVYTVRDKDRKFYLIGPNGDIIKSKKNAVDADGYEFNVKNKKILTITVEE